MPHAVGVDPRQSAPAVSAENAVDVDHRDLGIETGGPNAPFNNENALLVRRLLLLLLIY